MTVSEHVHIHNSVQSIRDILTGSASNHIMFFSVLARILGPKGTINNSIISSSSALYSL